MRLLLISLVLFGLLLSGSNAFSATKVIGSETCLSCHEDVVSEQGFAMSVHGKNGCTSCHAGITDLDDHISGKVKVGEVTCTNCHKERSAEHFSSVHMVNDIGCTSCHSEIHTQEKWSGAKQVVVDKCLECHDDGGYAESIHGQGVASGNEDSAACHDCHALHAIRSVSDMEPKAAGRFHSERCISCHDDQGIVARNGLLADAVETYIDSYHGKNYGLGYAEQAAGCVDCHSAHAVQPKAVASSTINEANIVATCGQCHSNSSRQFAKFYAHGNHSDSENYPILYWTYAGMTGLLVGTFAVFWIHTLLWMFRGFVDNRQRQLALAKGEGHHIPDAHKLYKRFEKRHIYLHLTVIISFLGLSLTGLPLKFSDQEWAKSMMSFYGGVHYAGLIHRGCAILTFYYFLGAILMSIDFLFVRKDIKSHWLFRLFGPESLMPNFRDVRDIKNMVKWFFFKGPKPNFERWTYWEKFDFLAVFWGMFAIGGSGLLLWFPEFFGYLLPGWMFNVATIVHSDEALLATGFIFTVHFFNTHGRPEKFPMDFVIFNGQMTKEEFIEERGDQWNRYEEAGITEEFVVSKPSGVLYDFLFKGFGFIALFTGLSLAFLMLYAFIRG